MHAAAAEKLLQTPEREQEDLNQSHLHRKTVKQLTKQRERKKSR